MSANGTSARYRVGVHLEALWPGQIGGIERHVRQLLTQWPALDPDLELVLALAPHNADTFEAGPRVETRVLDADAFRALDAGTLAEWRLDAWFCPLLTLEPEAPGLPSAVLIPDFQHETYPRNFSEEVLEWRREHYARTVRDADRVITISDFSRRHMLERLPEASADRAVRVHLGAAPHFTFEAAHDPAKRAAVRAHYRLEDGYLLYPAHGWPHKNHETLFRALARLVTSQEKGRGNGAPRLVLTGGGADESWPARWRELGIEDHVRHLGHVSDADLPSIYAGASMLVFPSRFEGFGFPVLEAMICGCPVLCGRNTSLPEVGGDAVAYVDRDDPEALAESIDALLGDDDRRRDLIARGRSRARRFSARRAATETLDAIRALIGRAPLPARQALHLDEAPPITIVTPSFEQAAFLPRTLDSVLGQDYPNLEYLIMDGGSEDGSVEILERYRRRHPEIIDYVSEPDGGQADAVNKGLARARGAIIGWLNSDDLYRPGALEAVADAFADHPEHGWLYGRADYIDHDDDLLRPYPTRAAFDWETLAHNCYICQPAAFWMPARLGDRGGAQAGLEATGLEDAVRLDANLAMCMDYDFWIRIGAHHQPLFLDRVLAASRVHDATKTLGQRADVFEETLGTVKRHYGYVPLSWAAGKAHYLRRPLEDPLTPRRVALGTKALAALLVLRYNLRDPRYVARAWRQLLAPTPSLDTEASP